MPEERAGHEQAAYAQVCTSYHAVDDIRMKLLGLLPIATGTGVFLLLSGTVAVSLSGARSSVAARCATSSTPR